MLQPHDERSKLEIVPMDKGNDSQKFVLIGTRFPDQLLNENKMEIYVCSEWGILLADDAQGY